MDFIKVTLSYPQNDNQRVAYINKNIIESVVEWTENRTCIYVNSQIQSAQQYFVCESVEEIMKQLEEA